LGTISKYAVPQDVTFADSLPKTSVGKLDKKAMRAHYAELAQTPLADAA